MINKASTTQKMERRAEDEWCTSASSGKFLIRRVDDYHELVGGDFYDYIPIDTYLVVGWNSPNTDAVHVCESLEDAYLQLLALIDSDRQFRMSIVEPRCEPKSVVP